MPARFLQIHTLTSYAASLLNRDDAGFAKRMPFGGAIRTRVSSQCLKRHWRVYEGENGLGSIDAPESVRSRVSFERYIVEPLVREGTNDTVARAAAQKIIGKVFGGEAKKEKAEKKGGKKSQAEEESAQDAVVRTAQVTVLGRPELDYLCQIAREAIRDAGGDVKKVETAIDTRMKNERELKKNIQALKPGSLEAGLGAALFGRMVTGDVLARTDGAIHVAHAMTVHGQMTESDYFSAIDDLIREEGEQESGHINATELTSGVFYGYIVVDVDGLVANLGGDRTLAGDVVHKLVHMVATVSPGAKKGSTAPYAYSHLVLAECGKAQPRTLQNAFIEPVPTSGNLIANAYRAMAQHLADLDGMYGKTEQRAHAGLRTNGLFEQPMNLGGLADWGKGRVLE
ncbi:MAG: type I-E CRISPR-associated protein Cas7/Cse4/CasC [Gemmatimonadaceae bacterium]